MTAGSALFAACGPSDPTTPDDTFTAGDTLGNYATTASVGSRNALLTVGYSGSDPYVSCADYLKTVENTLRSGGTDTSGLQPYVISGAIDIDNLTDLTAYSSTFTFAGARTAMSSSATDSVVPRGKIAALHITRTPL